MKPSARTVLSFALMQAGWFACVVGATHGLPWLGPAVVSASLALHLRAQPPGGRAKEVAVLALAAALGFAVDTALLRAGVMALAGAVVSPPWLVALWPNLAAATARGGSLDSFERRPLAGVLFGLLGGPFAYDAGARLGAIDLAANRLGALAVVGLAWSCVLPAIFWLRGRVAPRHRRPSPGPP